MVRLGYNSNGFQSHRLDEATDWLAALGYRALALTPDVCHLDPASTTESELTAFGRRCQALDLTVVIETGARYVLDPKRKHRPNLLEVDGTDQKRRAFLEQMLRWAESLESPVLSLWSGALPRGADGTAARDQLATHLNGLCLSAEASGVRVALEPEPGHFIATVQDWREIAERVEGRLALSLDVGHLLVTEEGALEEVVEPVLSSVCNVQLDDMMPGVHEHLAPGEGQVDWGAVKRLMQRLPADTPACFELSRDSHRFHELAPQLISDFSF